MTPSTFEHFSTWLLRTKNGTTLRWIIEGISFVVGAMLALLVIYLAETQLFHVIKDWRIDRIERHGNSYVIQGTMSKVRQCELVATSVLAVPKTPIAPRVLIMQIRPDSILGGNAPTGQSTWGPFEFPIPQALLHSRDNIAFLEVVGTHRCHSAWLQETLYGRVDLEMLP